MREGALEEGLKDTGARQGKGQSGDLTGREEEASVDREGGKRDKTLFEKSYGNILVYVFLSTYTTYR